ncbi:MAG: prenyltransferase/squalene oxidase repeat-containing protein, partial [Planctomycetota bacterium]
MKRFLTCSLGLLLASAMALPAQSVRRFPPGVNAKIDAAIKRGLDYLVRTQNNDGSWRASGYGAYPTAMTALAGMALLGSGSTPTRGRHWQAVRKATNFLIKC